MALLLIRYLRLYFVSKNKHLVGFKPMNLSSMLNHHLSFQFKLLRYVVI
jgi:hypothetical protein